MTKTFIGENGLRAYGDTVYTTFFTFDFLPDGRWQYRIDFSRLIIIWIAITLAFTAVYFLLPVKKKSDPRG